MGRKKLPMKLISNKRARLVSLEKRKKGLKKAAYELSTLCGVDIGMIIYNCDSNESEISGSLARMIQLYASSSAQDRRCRAYGVADYIKEESEKAKKMRDKAGKDECGRLSHHQLRELGDLLDAKIGAVRGKISLMKAEAADVFLNQESGVFLNQDQQTMFWGNSLMQESLFLMPADIYGDMPDLVEASRNPIPETNSQLAADIIQDYDVGSEAMFWGNSLMQESFFLMPGTAVQQQQIDVCNNMPDLETNPFMMNQSVQGTATFMPDIIQQQWHAYYQAQDQNNVGF